ncbi:multidrug efflux SMR transporter [Methylopila sp. M107]|uniref:DMT family transporter n=1 Tax=Methylopila sp. M107 TaxID=1101190 RepID=UPI00047844F6|nr:multidrug efflux SMR transporter [Methylopila sp. M107]
MAWLYLAAAAVFEIVFALGMKYSQGFTKLGPSVLTAVAVAGGLGFLGLALKDLPVSVAYPIWTAVGTLGTVVFGFALLGEALTLAKVLSAVAIVGGVAGLKIASS